MKKYIFLDQENIDIYKKHIDLHNISNVEFIFTECSSTEKQSYTLVNDILKLNHNENFFILLNGFYLKNGLEETVNLFENFIESNRLDWDIMILDLKDEKIWASQKPLNFPKFSDLWGKIGEYISENMLRKIINFPYPIDQFDKRKPSFNYSNLDSKLLYINSKNIKKISQILNLENLDGNLILHILNNKLKLNIYATNTKISFGDLKTINHNLTYRPIVEIVSPKEGEIVYRPDYLARINIHKSLINEINESQELNEKFEIFLNNRRLNGVKFFFNWNRHQYLLNNNLFEINFYLNKELDYFFSKLEKYEEKEINIIVNYQCSTTNSKIKNKNKFFIKNDQETLEKENAFKQEKEKTKEILKAFVIQ